MPQATMLRHMTVTVALGAFRIWRRRAMQSARGHFQLKLCQRGVNHCEVLLAKHHTKGKP